jgi:hypothetical protein
MRTVWLALFCLIGLATAVVVKLGTAPYVNADVSQAAVPADVSREPPAAVPPSSEGETIATGTQSNTLKKADRLEPTYIDEIRSVKSAAIKPIETESKISNRAERIVSRHWHDPYDNPGAMAAQPSAKRKSAKATTTRP